MFSTARRCSHPPSYFLLLRKTTKIFELHVSCCDISLRWATASANASGGGNITTARRSRCPFPSRLSLRAQLAPPAAELTANCALTHAVTTLLQGAAPRGDDTCRRRRATACWLTGSFSTKKWTSKASALGPKKGPTRADQTTETALRCTKHAR